MYVSAYSEDSYPFIPDSNSSFVRFDEKDYIQYEKRIETPVVYYYDSEEAVFIFNETGIQDKNKPANNILTVYISSELAHDGSYRKRTIPEYFFNAAGYYSVSVNPGISGDVTGGFAAGFTVWIDKFLETGVIDIGTSANLGTTGVITTLTYTGKIMVNLSINFCVDLIKTPSTSQIKISFGNNVVYVRAVPPVAEQYYSLNRIFNVQAGDIVSIVSNESNYVEIKYYNLIINKL